MQNLEELLQRYRVMDLEDDHYVNEEMPTINRLFGLKNLLDFYKVDKTWNIAEVGSFAGASGELFAYYANKVYCCDIWEAFIEPPERAKMVKKTFDKVKSRNPNIVEVKKSSELASKDFEDATFDLIYIDADHIYKSVKNDIKCWLPKIKLNGVFCGHDYFFPDVKRAADEFFGERNLKHFEDSSWSIKVTEEVLEFLKYIKH